MESLLPSGWPMRKVAAYERAAPLAIGLVMGAAAAIAAPCAAEAEFFSTAAQILPVLILALVLEAPVFGGPLRRRPDEDTLAVEVFRRVAEYGIVLVLIAAELQAVLHAASDDASHNPWFVYGAIGWGFATIAALAPAGRGKPRVTATLKWRPKPNRWIVEVGMANVYGDKNIEPLVNFLVPVGHDFLQCTQAGKITEHEPPTDMLETTEDDPFTRQPKRWSYRHVYPLITAGDAAVRYYSIGMLPEGGGGSPQPIPVQLRVDHVELPNGRVSVNAMLDPVEPGEALSKRA